MGKYDNVELFESDEILKEQEKNCVRESTTEKEDVGNNNMYNLKENTLYNDINTKIVSGGMLMENRMEMKKDEKKNLSNIVDPMANIFSDQTLEKNSNPSVIIRQFDITQKEQIIRYNYALVFYKNFNIFFITHNGKFASWVCSCNSPFADTYEQETEIIFGERDHLYLEMFCSKFMNDCAAIFGETSVLFAISIYKMCFDDVEVLKQIFDNLMKVIKEIYSLKNL